MDKPPERLQLEQFPFRRNRILISNRTYLIQAPCRIGGQQEWGDLFLTIFDNGLWQRFRRVRAAARLHHGSGLRFPRSSSGRSVIGRPAGQAGQDGAGGAGSASWLHRCPDPHVTPHQLKDELAARGIKVGHNTIWLFLRCDGLRFKKTLFALEQGRSDVARRRRLWRSWQAGLDPRRWSSSMRPGSRPTWRRCADGLQR